MSTVSTQAGDKIMCAWDDCTRNGLTEHEIRKPRVEGHPKSGALIYLFCSARHKALYGHSHRQLFHLPVGSRGLLPPR